VVQALRYARIIVVLSAKQFTAWLLDTCLLYADLYLVPGCRHLQSAESGQLDFPQFRLSTYHMRSIHIRQLRQSVNLELASFLLLEQFTLFIFFPASFKHSLFISLSHIVRLRLRFLYVIALYRLKVDFIFVHVTTTIQSL